MSSQKQALTANQLIEQSNWPQQQMEADINKYTMEYSILKGIMTKEIIINDVKITLDYMIKPLPEGKGDFESKWIHFDCGCHIHANYLMGNMWSQQDFKCSTCKKEVSLQQLKTAVQLFFIAEPENRGIKSILHQIERTCKGT